MSGLATAERNRIEPAHASKADARPATSASAARHGDASLWFAVATRRAPPSSRRPNTAARKTCACGGAIEAGGECTRCRASRGGPAPGPIGPALGPIGPALGEAPRIVHDVLRSPGSALDPGTREAMAQRLGADLSRVRVHTGARAATSARAVGARAYTVGSSIVFNRGQYAPGTPRGRELLAHELVHTVQQAGGDGPLGSPTLRLGSPDSATEAEARSIAAAPSPAAGLRPALRARPHLARDGVPAAPSNAAVDYIELLLASSEVVFHAGGTTYSYALHHRGMRPGTYQTAVEVTADRVRLTPAAGSAPMTGRWSWAIRAGQQNPSTLLRGQSSVELRISDRAPEAPASPSPPTEPPAAPEPAVVAPSPDEALARCRAGGSGVMTFPLRLTRFGAAPISAERQGDRIRVHQPVYVLANGDFRGQTRTLPVNVFTGGHEVAPDEIVRVRIYTPHWYHLNVTGDATGDEQRDICVTGSQLLEFSSVSDTAVLMNIGLTALDALPFTPAGQAIGRVIGRVTSAVTTRVLRPAAAAAMIGVSEAAPAVAGRVAPVAAAAAEEQLGTRAAQQVLAPAVERPLAAAAQSRAVGAASEAALPRAAAAAGSSPRSPARSRQREPRAQPLSRPALPPPERWRRASAARLR